jgi:hypothetical protein
MRYIFFTYPQNRVELPTSAATRDLLSVMLDADFDANTPLQVIAAVATSTLGNGR